MLVSSSGTSASDEAYILFQEWLKGKELMLVKLFVHVPRLDADKCFVAVHRLSAPYNPVKNGLTERLYAGMVKPGTIVEVKSILSAIPAKLSQNPEGTHVDYYEPQQYIVLVSCIKGGRQVYKWFKVVEVYPDRILYRFDIYPGKQRTILDEDQIKEGDNIGITRFACNIVVDNTGDDYEHGYCFTFAPGPRLYSIDGLEASFGICNGVGIGGISCSKPTAVYLESFADAAWCPLGYCDHDTPQWDSAGKTLVPSIVTRTTYPLSGDKSVRLYFGVKYEYVEYWWWDSFSGDAMRYWLLLPTKVTTVVRGDVLGVERPSDYTPSPPPSYSFYEPAGRYTLIFGEYGVKETDIAISAVSVTFSYANTWSVTLTVHFYKAGRQDNEYMTPFLLVRAGYPHYVWFRDNDPMTYEALFHR